MVRAPLNVEPLRLRPPYRCPDPDRETRPGESTAKWRDRMLADALAALTEPLRGLPLSDHETRYLVWLAGWDVPTVATVAHLLHCAREAAPLPEAVTP